MAACNTTAGDAAAAVACALRGCWQPEQRLAMPRPALHPGQRQQSQRGDHRQAEVRRRRRVWCATLTRVAITAVCRQLQWIRGVLPGLLRACRRRRRRRRTRWRRLPLPLPPLHACSDGAVQAHRSHRPGHQHARRRAAWLHCKLAGPEQLAPLASLAPRCRSAEDDGCAARLPPHAGVEAYFPGLTDLDPAANLTDSTPLKARGGEWGTVGSMPGCPAARRWA